MKGEGSRGGGGGGEGGEERPQKIFKKGMWSPQEDAILTEYVRRHGEGNWNAVHRHTSLLRNGKSCRLRWVNHLRPTLKRGAFSPEEENLIVQLHAEHGNKWAHIASLLPGRTDNDVKNFLNTIIKRSKKAKSHVNSRRPRRVQNNGSSSGNPNLNDSNAQPHPFFFGASSSQWNWPGPPQNQCHWLPMQSTMVGLRHDWSALCAESRLPFAAAGLQLPSIQMTPLGGTVPGYGGGCGSFATRYEGSNIGLLGDLSAEAENLALKEEEKKSESSGGDGVDVGASSSFSAKPIEKPINEIEWMDDDLSSLLATFASTRQANSLALKEQKEKSDGLGGNGAEAATSLFSVEPTEGPRDNIERMNNDLSSLIASFATTVKTATLALKEVEKKKSDILCDNGAKAATSSSFQESTDKIDRMDDGMDDGLSSLFASFSSTMQANTLALKEEEEKSESLGGDAEAATSSFTMSVEPTEEPIDEIEHMDDDLSSLLNSFASTIKVNNLALKEKEEEESESLGGHGAKAIASSSLSVEPTEEPIDEIELVGDDLSSILASSTSTMQVNTLALNEGEKKKSESLGHNGAGTVASSSLSMKPTEELICEMEGMDDELSNLLASFTSTMQTNALAPKEEEEKKKSEILGSDGAEAAHSFSFSLEPTKESIDEIELMDDDLSGLLASFASTMQVDTLALKEDEKNTLSLGGDGAKTGASSSCSVEPTKELIDEIEIMDNNLSILLASFSSNTRVNTPALKEEEEENEILGSDGAEVANSSSFEPNEEPIYEIERMDNDLSSLLASFASTTQACTLALEEEEKKTGSLGSDGAEVAASSSFSVLPTVEPINKIKCMDDDLSSLLAGFASKMQAKTLALEAEEEEEIENLGGDGDEAVASSSSSMKPTEEPIDDIDCTNDLSSLLASFTSTMPFPYW